MSVSPLPEAGPTIAQLSKFSPCTASAYNHNDKAAACAWLPARRPSGPGMQTRFQLLELSHVCTAFSPTALVVPFENLRMTDVEAVGGKNASLGEMISQLPKACACPRASPPPPTRSANSWPMTAWPTSISAKPRAWTPGTCALSRRWRRDRAMVEASPSRLTCKKPLPTNLPSSALATPTHRLPCARPPRPKICPTHRLLASRKPS